MATAAQQQAFAAQYGPYAQQAGSRLGVDPNIILGQWGMETGWQTPSTGNLAGISPGGKLASYSSPQAFTDSYVSTISNNFPGAVGAGTDANAFNNGLVNGPKGSYYQGNDAASKGLTTPTAYDQSSYLASLQSSQSHNLVQYSSGAAPYSGDGSSTLASNAVPDGGNSYYDPETGTYTNGISPYTTTGVNSGNYPGAGSLSGGYVAPDGSYVPAQAVPGVTPSSTANPIVAGAGDPGYLPPASTGGLQETGLSSGTVSTIGGWISGIETAVGNWMTQTLGDVFAGAVNWFARAGLIILGMILLAFALWRILDPSGEKTQTVARYAAEAA